MNLILWRHAEAEEGTPDLKRNLTKRGLKQAAAMAEWLHPQLPADTRVLVSPAERTKQTAIALTSDFEIVKDLAPGKGVEDLLAAVQWPEGGGYSTTVVVGHQPTLGAVASLLIGGEEDYWTVRKGAIWWLAHRMRGEESQTVLRTVMGPDQLM